MKPFLTRSRSLIPLILFPLTFNPQVIQFLRPFSSVPITKTKWNSITKVVITNPTLLILESCTNMNQLKQIQAHMTRTGLITDAFPLSRILAFCALADGGDIHYAHLLFTEIERPNTYMWNTMIRGYCRYQLPLMGFSTFQRMVRYKIEVDGRSFIFALKACGQFLRELQGESLHCLIWKMGFDSDLLARNGLIYFYVERGFLPFARQVFDGGSVRDVVTWTSMIDGYATHNCLEDAIRLFDLMLSSDVEPNEVTMTAVISACSQKGDLSMAKSIHYFISKKNLCSSLNLLNAILDMYVKCGDLVAGKEIFENMSNKDVYSWTSLLNGYAKCGDLESARKLFDVMPERNVISWNAMISGYSQNNKPKEALRLFQDMLRAGLFPIEDTLASVISACGQLGCLNLGQWIHHHYVKGKQIQFSVILGNALVDMYAKCGSIDSAAEVFYAMEERNLVSWNSMILGYASHGDAKEALVLFERMKSAGLKPDHITFVGVLSACCHSGLVSEGREHFKSMEKRFGIEPKEEHYACLIDLLGRVGHLDEAYEIARTTPNGPSAAAWGAVLNACRMHENVELAKVAAETLMELDPEDSGTYVLLANTCAKGGRWSEVRKVRRMMRERGVKKAPGHSLIEVEGEFHEFLVADDCHPRSAEVYKTLNEIFSVSRVEEDHASDYCQFYTVG